MRRLPLLFFFLSLGINLSAQTWEVGVFGGTSGYMGDLQSIKPHNFTDIAFGGQLKRNFDGYWSAKLNFLQAEISGNDAESNSAYQRERNLSFQTAISELSLQVEFNLFNYLPGMLPGYGTRRLSPYIFTGFAALRFNPTTDFNGQEIELQPIQTESVAYNKNAFSVPYGVGVKYNVSGNWNLIAEIGYRTAFTDYLDDISGRYPDFNVNPPASIYTPELSDRSETLIGEAGVQRGDFRKRDTYMAAGLSLTYTFVPIKCPTF